MGCNAALAMRLRVTLLFAAGSSRDLDVCSRELETRGVVLRKRDGLIEVEEGEQLAHALRLVAEPRRLSMRVSVELTRRETESIPGFQFRPRKRLSLPFEMDYASRDASPDSPAIVSDRGVSGGDFFYQGDYGLVILCSQRARGWLEKAYPSAVGKVLGSKGKVRDDCCFLKTNQRLVDSVLASDPGAPGLFRAGSIDEGIQLHREYCCIVYAEDVDYPPLATTSESYWANGVGEMVCSAEFRRAYAETGFKGVDFKPLFVKGTPLHAELGERLRRFWLSSLDVGVEVLK